MDLQEELEYEVPRAISEGGSLPEYDNAYYLSDQVMESTTEGPDYDEHLLMMAFNNQDNEQILEFIDEQTDWKLIKLSEDKESLLHIGIFSHNFSICKALLKRNAPVDAQNKEGHTPLHSAVLQKLNWKYIDLILKFNCDPKIKDNLGKTALHYVRWVSCLNIILKESSSNPDPKSESLLDSQDKLGNTWLNESILNLSEGTVKITIIKEMVKKDADFSIQNKIGNNALMIASQIGNSDILGMAIMKMLNDELNNKLIGKHLLSSKAILKQTNKQGHDILMIAIIAKSKECIGILLDIANMEITKEHLSIAKEFTSDNSKLYNYIKKRFHAQDGI